MGATASAGEGGPRSFLHRPAVRNVLSGAFVALGGFALFNISFVLIWLVSLSVQAVFPQLPLGPPGLIAGLALIAVASWFLLRSNMRPLFKAAYATIPLAWSYVALGVLFWQTPALSFAIGGILTLAILAYLYRAKKPWIYAYTVALVATALAVSSLMGLEI